VMPRWQNASSPAADGPSGLIQSGGHRDLLPHHLASKGGERAVIGREKADTIIIGLWVAAFAIWILLSVYLR
jgi:hypothetical protein